MSIKVKVEHQAWAHVVAMEGDLAFDTVGPIKRILDELAESNGLPVIFDLEKLEFIDSKGAGMLIETSQKFKEGKFVLAGMSPNIRDVLARLFLLERFIVFKNAKEALRLIHTVAAC